jgi:hypothetical protein
MPVDGDDADDAGLAAADCLPAIRHAAVALPSAPAPHASSVTNYAFPSPATRYASLIWHLLERAAAAPRAPASLA